MSSTSAGVDVPKPAAATTTTTMTTQSQPQQPQQEEREDDSATMQQELERIPTYAESSAQPRVEDILLEWEEEQEELRQRRQSTISQADLPTDSPPAYAMVPIAQTTFSLHGTFVHTPSGPAYQLSCPLDTRGPYFRIRRLHPREVAHVGVVPVAFDKAHALYEVNDPPMLDNEYHIRGHRRGCFPGVLELSSGLTKWKVRHVLKPGGKGKEIVKRKSEKRFRGSAIGRAEWVDGEGRVLATEVMRDVEWGGGGVVPVVVLREGLDQSWKELLVCLWVTRLWVAVGKEKTAAVGGYG